MKRLLFATDFSDRCQNVLSYLKKLLRITKAKVDLIHVFEIPTSMLSSASFQSGEELLKEKNKAILLQLKQQMRQFNFHNRGKIFCIQGAYPSTEIAKIANKHQIDLIVMALRMRQSLMNKIIGRTATNTMRKSAIPVLAIPEGAKYKHIKHILFPTAIQSSQEISNDEKNALEWLFSFTRKSKIRMIHIKSDDPDIYINYKNNPFPSLDFIRTKANSAGEGIIKYLESHKIDLMAFYKPNRSFWERLYHSSVSRKLLYKSRIPLLVF